ncbi:MAG: DUF5721 family protein [Lachnospiraceae bacterium]|nr:DUF5721 family protein [Lachnospiraceae bacterium]
MQVFLIKSKKEFMTELLTGASFDALLLSEARIEGRGHLSVTGHPAAGFFTEEEMSRVDPSGYMPYGMYRDTLFSFIKGNRTPSGFMIQLVLPRSETEELVGSSGCTIPSSDVESLSLLIRFRDGALSVTTGTSISGFYPDKSLDHALDAYAAGILDRCGADYDTQL